MPAAPRRLAAPHEEPEAGCSSGFMCLDICDELLLLGLVLVCLLALVLVLETLLFLLHHYEPWLIRQIEKECATLGMISFFLFLFSNGKDHLKLGHHFEHYKEVIEYVHMTLFLTMLAYFVAVAALAKSERVLSRRWQRADQLTDEETKQVEADFQVGHGQHGPCKRMLLASFRMLFSGWNGTMATVCQMRCKQIVLEQYKHLLQPDGRPAVDYNLLFASASSATPRSSLHSGMHACMRPSLGLGLTGLSLNASASGLQFDHAIYLKLNAQAMLARLMHVGPRAWLLLMLSFCLVLLPFDAWFWFEDGFDHGINQQQYCTSSFSAFEKSCGCTVVNSSSHAGGPRDCTCTGQHSFGVHCEQLCEGEHNEEWLEAVVKNTALQSVFLVWSWGLCVAGQLVMTLSTARVFDVVCEAAAPHAEAGDALLPLPAGSSARDDPPDTQAGAAAVGSTQAPSELASADEEQAARPPDAQPGVARSRAAASSSSRDEPLIGSYGNQVQSNAIKCNHTSSRDEPLLGSYGSLGSVTASTAAAAANGGEPGLLGQASQHVQRQSARYAHLCRPPADKYRRLFLFNSPHLLVHIFQIQLLGQCAHVALFCMTFAWLPNNGWAFPLFFVPPIYFASTYTMRTLERCTLLFSIRSLAKEERVLEAIVAPGAASLTDGEGSL